MDKQLRSSVFIGWISGTFPVKSFRSLESSWTTWTVPLSIIVTMYYGVVEGWSIWAQKSVIAGLQPSKLIVSYLTQANVLVTCILMRLWSFWRTSALGELVNTFLEMQQDWTYPRGTYVNRYYALGYVMLLIDVVPGLVTILGNIGEKDEATTNSRLITGNATPQFWQKAIFDYVPLGIIYLTRFFGLMIILWLGVNLLHIFECFCWDLQKMYCPTAVERVHIIDDEDTEDEEDEDDPCNDLKRSSQATQPQEKKETFFAELMEKFPALLRSYSEKPTIRPVDSDEAGLDAVFSTKTVDMWATTAKKIPARASIITPELSVSDLSTKFLRIQQLFDDFNRITGPSFFILICYGTISLIHKLYSVAASELHEGQAQAIKFAAKSTIGFLLICGLAHLGEVMTSRIKKWKEQLKCVMLTELLCDKCHDSVNTLTESIIKWDWQLSAMSLFNINHALLPGIAGTMVTYLIVIIQLKVSESSTGPQNGTAGAILTLDE